MLESITLGMMERGHEVDVLAFGEPLYPGCGEFDRVQPYRIFRVPASGHRSKEILAMAIKLMAAASSKRYDVIFCGVAWSSALLALLPKYLRRIPFIIYTHGEDTTVVVGSKWKESLMRQAFRHSSGLMTNSNFSKEAVERQGGRAGICEVLYPTIDSRPFLEVQEGQSAELIERLGLKNCRLLLTVARLQRRKGHDTVVRCLPALAAQFPDVHYVVLGKGDRAELTELAKELNVLDRLTIIDYISENDLPVLYRSASVHVMVSRWDPEAQEVEGFGMAYLEAAAAGKPSVAGNHGGASDAVVNGSTGITVDPTSVEQTADAIARLLADPTLASEMGLAGQARAMKEFSTKHFLDTIEDRLVKAAKST